MENRYFTTVTAVCLLACLLVGGIKTGWRSLVAFRQEELTADSAREAALTFTSYWEDAYTAHLPLQMKWIELNGLWQRLAGKSFVEDIAPDKSVVKDGQGGLHFSGYWYLENSFVAEGIYEQLAPFQQFLAEQKIPLYYIAAPEKVIAGYTVLPPLLNNYLNENVDAFLAVLQKAGIATLDLRAMLSESSSTKEGLFYRTDHHWTTPTAFQGFCCLVDTLEKSWGWQLDTANLFCDIDNYTETTYEKSFVGSQGRRVGKYYAGVDDFTLLLPQFDTSFRVIDQAGNVKEGTYTECFLAEEYLLPEDVYTNRYAAFLGGDSGILTIENLNFPEGKRLLLLKDSFAAPAATFLASCVSSLTLIDLRYYEGSVEELVKEIKPDGVLFLYSSGSLADEMFRLDE